VFLLVEFQCGFHGHNGLDPVSLLHIYKTYITPVLLYGMELLLPSSKPLEQLELFQKRILKQILSLPMSCPDPVVYILTGILPIETQIHIKALTFFNNVCHQGEKNTEKKLARRQLTVKGNDRICFSILFWKSSSCSRGFEDGNNSSIP
jgi:hypothetical protein